MGAFPRSWWRAPAALRAGFAIAAAGLAVGGILLSLSIGHYDDAIDHHRRAAQRVEQPDELRADAIDAADRAAVAFLTVSGGTSSPHLEALLSESTPGSRNRLRRQAASFAQALGPGKAVSAGSVSAAGLVSLSPNEAVVAVAAKATVGTGRGSGDERRDYRLTVSLRWSGNQWRVFDLAFVV